MNQLDFNIYLSIKQTSCILLHYDKNLKWVISNHKTWSNAEDYLIYETWLYQEELFCKVNLSEKENLLLNRIIDQFAVLDTKIRKSQILSNSKKLTKKNNQQEINDALADDIYIKYMVVNKNIDQPNEVNTNNE